MSTIRNPKQEGTRLWDCIPQTGKCPIGCSNCFFNRPDAYYYPHDKLPLLPDPEEVGDDIVRMNCGNDSNVESEKVIAAAARYKHAFFNTSIPKLDHFPGPVVLTANPKEENLAVYLTPIPRNLMFVRLRVSATNLAYVDVAIEHYTAWSVPVVLTFMAYYDKRPEISKTVHQKVGMMTSCYKWRVRHINSYWCPTPDFMRFVMKRYKKNRLVSMCSSMNSAYCRACLNCETYYFQTRKRLLGE